MSSLGEDYCRTWDVHAPSGLVEQVFAVDVLDHDPQAGQGPGRAGIEAVIALYQAVFPDLAVAAEDTVVQGDRVAVRWSATGTHESDQLGVPATHRRVRLSGIDILRVEAGRVVERWGESNGLELMQQLAPVPAQPAYAEGRAGAEAVG